MSDKPKFDPSQPFDPVEKPKFDPSQPFDEVTEPKMGWGEYVGRGATGAIPAITGAAGGAIGATAGGPVGAVGGAGLGYAGGKEMQGILNHYLFNDEIPDTNPMKQAARVANNTAEGATMEMGGQALAAGAKAVAKPVMDTVGGAVKAGAEKLADDAPEMVGNAIRKGGETFRLPFLSEKATGTIADRIAQPAEDLTRSAISRFTGRATESAAETAAPGIGDASFWTGATRPPSEPAHVLSKVTGSQFEAPLKSALQRGDDAYRSMVFLLGQQYPQFRKLMINGQ
jgi:hypothetical protein